MIKLQILGLHLHNFMDLKIYKNFPILFIITLILTTNSSALIRTEQIELVSGWNLISIPLDSGDYAIQSVLKSIDGQYTSVWTL